MAEDTVTTAGIGKHGASRLPSVDIDSYNIELKDEDGFLGDRASKGAFQDILERWRKPLRKNGDDPFGGNRTSPRSIVCAHVPSNLSPISLQVTTLGHFDHTIDLLEPFARR